MRNCEGALIIFYEKMSAPKKKNEDRSKLVMKNKKTGRKSDSLIHCIPQFSQVACLNILSNVGGREGLKEKKPNFCNREVKTVKTRKRHKSTKIMLNSHPICD